MISSSVTAPVRRGVATGRMAAVLVTILLVAAATIGFMLVPMRGEAASSSDPKVSAYVTDGEVHAVTTYKGITYIGGDFTHVGPVGGPMQTRKYIAALNASTGVLTSWNPNADSTVFAIVVSGTTVYAGGYFTFIGGQARNYIAALNTASGGATSWNPNAGAYVYALAISGTTVFAGGQFTQIAGQARNYIAALNTASGTATSWNPNASGGQENVYALAVSGTTVYAGGDFTNIGGKARNRIAAINNSGLATSWNPNSNGGVRALAVSGTTVYAGGNFSSVGGKTRNFVAAINSSGTATSWNPNADDSVRALAVSGTTVFVGGKFRSIGGQKRNNIAAIATSGGATSWNPNPNSLVLALAVSGSNVYVGGSFDKVGGKSRAYFAQFTYSVSPKPTTTGWMLAEGSTWPGYDEWVLVQNPNNTDASVSVTFLTPKGKVSGPKLTVPHQSRTTVHVNQYVPDQDVSTIVTSTNGVPVCAERAMYFNAPDGKWGSHDSIAAKGTAQKWYLAEGATWPGYDEWVLVMNPNGSAVKARITFQTPQGEVPGPTLNLAAMTRGTVHVNDYVPNQDVSTKVQCLTSGKGVVAERSMYVTAPDGKRGSHNSVGVTEASGAWALAEGATWPGFEEWVLIQNPTGTSAGVEMFFLTPEGTYKGPVFDVGPGQRTSVRVNDYLPNADVSTMVYTSDPEKQAVVVERSMYVNTPDGKLGAHNAPGSAYGSVDWFLPEGCTSPGFDEWILAMNPEDKPVEVQLTFMTPNGPKEGPTTTIEAGHRQTFHVNEYVTGDVSTVVHGNGYVVAERAMYMYPESGKSGATDSLGVRHDDIFGGGSKIVAGGKAPVHLLRLESVFTDR